MFIYMSVYPSPDEWKRSFGLSIVPHISFRTALFLILTLTCGARSSMRAKIPLAFRSFLSVLTTSFFKCYYSFEIAL